MLAARIISVDDHTERNNTMEKIISLLKDNAFFASLLNGPCKPADDFVPINPDWIDDALSDQVTEVFHSMIPSGLPFITLVRVIRNPDSGSIIDDPGKRTRYIVVNVLPDNAYTFGRNFPLINALNIATLFSWALNRVIAAQNRSGNVVRIEGDASAGLLNYVNPEWVTLYLGEKEYTGFTNLTEVTAVEDSLLEMDIHLKSIRSINDALCQRLVETTTPSAEYAESPAD